MEIREIDRQKDWEVLADRVMAPLPQRWIYGEAAKRIGREVQRLCVFDRETRPLAMAQVILRPMFGMRTSLITRGPLFLETCERKAAVKALRRALPFGIKLMSPEEPLAGLKLSAPPELAELDLLPDLDTLRAGLDGKWRNALKKAESSRLRVTQIQASAQTLMPLLKAEKDRQAEGKYRGLPPEFALALQDVAPRSLRLFAASDAQMLFVLHGNSATYQIGHTGPEGRKANAHNLILWDAMKRLKAEGVMRLDLGTLDREKAPDLARFKLRTGAKARKLAPATLM
ncbi:GNAT family N-acetyltransferase [Celeribacter neptunius]|uniref:Acetyltransferase (GNAT) domain-containing protein n=1 Tax=Celeribacter neptunius TaxID=588602 RepID=A0A1I3N457_9RHOB|nr:GNAT family N-acetyltransferase [Celeribacter neptunius]SFJ03800.1 Acetyltransferase (GNAT) domain-containing protein [Celeribacter neptunius]